MSCVQWDDMLAICIEFAEYNNEGVVIGRKSETIIKNLEEPNDLALTELKTKNKKNREKVLV
jgi:uncharacterized membrane protein